MNGNKQIWKAILSLAMCSGAVNAVTIENTNCMQDAANTAPYHSGALSCSSNDVKIANTTNIEVLQNNCLTDGSGTVTFKADFQIESNATNRYNVGIYFATDNDTNQDGALTGTCSITTLPTIGPEDLNDVCGDISSSNPVTQSILLTASCANLDATGKLKLPYCTAWNNNNGVSCASAADAVPGSSSKCKCESGSAFQVPLPGAIHVSVSTFDGDNTNFSYSLTGPNAFDQTRPTSVENETGADFVALPQGTYHLAQNNIPGWVLVNASCKDGETEIAQNPDGSFDISILSGNIVNCDFSNAFPTKSVSIQNSLVSNADEDGSGSISVGDVLTIGYSISNTGDVALSGIAVSDSHEGLSQVSCELAPDAALLSGISTNCSASYTVTQADIDLGNIHNESSVTAQADDTSVSASASFDVAIAQHTVLTLVIAPSSSVFEKTEDIIGYSYAVSNNGNTTILGSLSITDDKNLVLCPEITFLAPGAFAICTSSYLITQDDLTAGSVTNTASALLGEVVSTPADATVTKLVVTPESTGGNGSDSGGNSSSGSSQNTPKATQSSTASSSAVTTPPLSSPSLDLLTAQGDSSGCGCNAHATPLSDANWILVSLMLITYFAWRRSFRQRRS